MLYGAVGLAFRTRGMSRIAIAAPTRWQVKSCFGSSGECPQWVESAHKPIYHFGMKHTELRAVVHNVADSLASGIGLLIGVYEMDVFGEAETSTNGALTVDFLNGTIVEGEASKSLADAVSLYRDALARLIGRAGGSMSALNEAKVRFWSDQLAHRFSITIEDSTGRRSTTEYAGTPARRVKTRDRFGRLRPKPSVRCG